MMTLSLQRIAGTRIVAKADAIDRLQLPVNALCLRFAPDEAFVTSAVTPGDVSDPYAIVEPDSSYVGAWLDSTPALGFLQRACEWKLPDERPAFAQGMVAGLPMKLWLAEEKVLLLVPAPYATDLQERIEYN